MTDEFRPPKAPNQEEVDKAIRETGCYVNWEAIKAMTEEEAGEFYGDLMDTFSGRTHHRLIVTAKDPATEIFVADTEGNLVVKAVGRLEESLATGYYDVHFGIKGERRRTRLSCATEVQE
jgi:hypothetical protein